MRRATHGGQTDRRTDRHRDRLTAVTRRRTVTSAALVVASGATGSTRRDVFSPSNRFAGRLPGRSGRRRASTLACRLLLAVSRFGGYLTDRHHSILTLATIALIGNCSKHCIHDKCPAVHGGQSKLRSRFDRFRTQKFILRSILDMDSSINLCRLSVVSIDLFF